MPDDKSLGSKFLGLFIESESKKDGDDEVEPSSDGQSAADLVAELARSTAPQAAAPETPRATPAPMPSRPVAAPVAPAPEMPASMASGSTDFESVFREAGMDVEELDRVKKAEELLRSLPESTPLAIQRQIVDASLRAFGFDIVRIVAASNNQMKALGAYLRVNETATAKSIEDAEQRIRALEEQMAQLREDILTRTRSLSELGTAAQARKAQIQKILDFFQPAGGPDAPAR